MKPYYEQDGITIFHGDCREILPSVDAAVMLTDPPFGIGYRSGKEGPYKGTSIANDDSTDVRDEALKLWGTRPALVFGNWRHPVYHAKQALVWDKGNGVGMGDLSIPWKPNWELIFVLGSGFQGKRTSGVLLDTSVVSWASKGRQHPNMKPTGLLKKLLAKCPDGIVIDPFMGSGSTLIAARDEGRQAIGIEISEEYCEKAVNRLRQKVLF
jgi:DNA modification methylase